MEDDPIEIMASLDAVHEDPGLARAVASGYDDFRIDALRRVFGAVDVADGVDDVHGRLADENVERAHVLDLCRVARLREKRLASLDQMGELKYALIRSRRAYLTLTESATVPPLPCTSCQSTLRRQPCKDLNILSQITRTRFQAKENAFFILKMHQVFTYKLMHPYMDKYDICRAETTTIISTLANYVSWIPSSLSLISLISLKIVNFP